MSAAPRLRLIRPSTYGLWCPGCMREHLFNVHDLNADGHVIGWDGDMGRPSLASELTYPGCSFTLRAGQMAFDLTSGHSLSGQIVPLPHYPLP